MPIRALRGVEGPAISLLKMVGPDSVKQQLMEIDELRERGMKKRGNEGFDWAGLVGSFMPGAAIAKGVTGALPAAKTLLGKMGVGATVGAATSGAQPIKGDELSTDKLTQMGTGAAIGGVLPALTQGVKSFFGTNQLNPTQAATLKEGQAAGYTVPPSMVNPSGMNNIMESLAGKAAVKQDAAARNSKITDALSARALRVPTDEPITPGTTDRVRREAGKAFENVQNLRPPKDMEWFPRYHDTDLVDQHKAARLAEKDAWKSFWRTTDGSFRDKALAAGSSADSLHNDIVKVAKANGREDLVKAMNDSRVQIAKAHDVENALNESSSHVSAPTLGKMFDKKGGKAMTGELATIGKMANAFGPVMGEAEKVPVAGVSGTDAMMSALLGGVGLGTSGPMGVAAAALPWVVRPAARNMALSKTYAKYAAEGIPARYIPLIDAMTQQATGAAGTAVGRNQ